MNKFQKRKVYVFNQIKKSDDILKGSVYEMKRYCGKQNCKCIKNNSPHKSLFLSFKHEGRTQLIPIKSRNVSEIKMKIKKYHQLKENIDQLTWINTELLKQEIKD